MKKLIRKGKIKEVYQTSEDRLEFLFTDNISVFEKEIPDEIPRKGETLCKTSTYWFEMMEKKGIKTHFIDKLDDARIEVEKIELKEDHDELDESTTDYLIPLEFISRYFVAGSLQERIEKGEIDPGILGFDEKPAYGERLPKPFFEVTTKVEGFDKALTKEKALSISGLNESEYEEIKETVFQMDNIIQNKVEKNGLIHVDGKKEFALDENRELVVVDTFGTADDDRFWEKDEYEEGNFVRRSKEFVKQYYKEIGYHRDLMKARREGKEEPPLPSLPKNMIEKTSALYVELMHRLTDGKYQKGGKK